VGDTVKDKSDSIRFLMLCQSWILGMGAIAPSAPLATPMLNLALELISAMQQNVDFKITPQQSAV